jgi:hypothetical protein
MSLDDDIKVLETKLKQKMYMSYHRDGLIDILIGWDLICIGLFLHFHSIVFSFLGWMPLLLFMPLKNYITIPRMGLVKFRTRRTPPMWILAGIGGIMLLASVVIGIFMKDTLGMVGPIALAIFGIAFMMVLVSGFNRIAGYAILVPLFFVVGLGLRFLTPAMVIVVGAGVMLMGIWMLVSFLRRYPVVDVEEPYVSE